MEYILYLFFIVLLSFTICCIIYFICKPIITKIWGSVNEFIRNICILLGEEQIKNIYIKICLIRYKHINLYVDKETCDIVQDYMLEDEKIENGMYYKLNIFDKFETPIPESIYNYEDEINNPYIDSFCNWIKPFLFVEIWKNKSKKVHRYFLIIKDRCKIEICCKGMYYSDGELDDSYHLDSLSVPIEVFIEAVKYNKFDYINFC